MARVAVLAAGGPAGVNVCRALDAAGHSVVGVDANEAHLAFAKPFCVAIERDFALFSPDLGEFGVDLVHSQAEEHLELLASRENGVFMPSPATIRLCREKEWPLRAWARVGLRSAGPFVFEDSFPDYLNLAKDRFGLPFWLRRARGAGARGSLLVESVAQGFHWLRVWEELVVHRRVAPAPWLAEQYLPGRDFCWTSLWRDGELMASFTRRRLEWLYPHLALSGRTGTPTIAKIVHDEWVNEMARDAVLAVDKWPNGIMAVDLREDAEGAPRPTEINAGRWPTTSPLYSEIGPNLVDMWVRLGLGEDVEPLGEDIYPAGETLLRHIDCGRVWA